MPTEMTLWNERLRPHRLAIGAAALVVALVVALVWVSWRWGVAEDRMALLQAQADAGFLQAPSTNSTVRLRLRDTGVASVGGGKFPERIDLLIDARTPRYSRFRVSLLREDGTLLFHADQMIRDSNYELRLSFNTSMLPQGAYLVRVEGYARGGKREPFTESRIRVS